MRDFEITSNEHQGGPSAIDYTVKQSERARKVAKKKKEGTDGIDALDEIDETERHNEGWGMMMCEED